MNSLLNGKDSRWLQLEVCREYQRNKCSRPDTECKFAHPPANVEVQNGRVTACYDSIKGRCNREKPPCKYFHPPQHLKDQLLINGRNHLAMKNAIMQHIGIAPGPSVLPGTVPAVDIQNGSTTVSPLGFSLSYGSQPIMATSPYLTGIPTNTYNPYFSGHLVPAALLGPDPSTVQSSLSHGVVPQGVTVAQQKIPRSDRLEVCREFIRGACKRVESECRFAHPADSVSAHEDGSVTVCMDAVKGRCARDPCRYFHPPLHLQAQIKAAQTRATATAPTSAASSSTTVGSGTMLAASMAAAVAALNPAAHMQTTSGHNAAAAAAAVAAAAAAAAGLSTSSNASGGISASTLAAGGGHPLEMAAAKKRAADNDLFHMMDMKSVGSFYIDNFPFPGMGVPFKRPAGEKSGIPVYQPGATTYQQMFQQPPYVPVSSSSVLPPNAPYVIYTDASGQLLDTLPVCQDFNRSMCSRLTCRFVHLMESDKVEVIDQRVSVCRDHANRICRRQQCKFYHIPVAIPPASVMATATNTGSTLRPTVDTATSKAPPSVFPEILDNSGSESVSATRLECGALENSSNHNNNANNNYNNHSNRITTGCLTSTTSTNNTINPTTTTNTTTYSQTNPRLVPLAHPLACPMGSGNQQATILAPTSLNHGINYDQQACLENISSSPVTATFSQQAMEVGQLSLWQVLSQNL